MSSEKREASPEASPLKGPAPKAVPEDTSDVQFEDGLPLNPMAGGGGDQAVQFISGTPANGDAKVELGDPSGAPTFVGLGKEELMKYANDPFWVRLRWLLFVLFWVLWIVMLAGAIVIIVFAPRCAEKKTTTETFYQIKAAELVKDGNVEAQTKYLKSLGVETIIISDVIQHDRNAGPEAVTDFQKLDASIDEGLFTKAVEGIRTQGMKVLLQLVPNHCGTSHEWFNDTSKDDFFVRRPFDEVKSSVWTTQDNRNNSWTVDPRDNTRAYLQQFSGNLADLDLRNDDVISSLKKSLSAWRERKIDGFLFSRASYLVEDLSMLMSRNATRNQPENVKVISDIVGITFQGTVLVELDDASDETIKKYTEKSMIPVIRSMDTSSIDKILRVLEGLDANPNSALNLQPTKTASATDKARLVNLLAIGGGSHAVMNHENTGDDKEYLMQVSDFQRQNPRGKQASVKFTSSGNVVTALRSDGEDHLVVANLGESSVTFIPQNFNITENVKGVVSVATRNANQKANETIEHQFDLARLSGVIIKLEKPETSE